MPHLLPTINHAFPSPLAIQHQKNGLLRPYMSKILTLGLTMLLYQRELLKKRKRKNENGIVLSASLTCDKHCDVWQPKPDSNIMQEKLRKAALGLSEEQIDE